jgi:hypothetical protein
MRAITSRSWLNSMFSSVCDVGILLGYRNTLLVPLTLLKALSFEWISVSLRRSEQVMLPVLSMMSAGGQVNSRRKAEFAGGSLNRMCG